LRSRFRADARLHPICAIPCPAPASGRCARVARAVFEAVGKACATFWVQTSTGARAPRGVGDEDGDGSAGGFGGGPVPDRRARRRARRAPARLDDRAQDGDERDGEARVCLGHRPRFQDALRAVRRARGSQRAVRQDRQRYVRRRLSRPNPQAAAALVSGDVFVALEDRAGAAGRPHRYAKICVPPAPDGPARRRRFALPATREFRQFAFNSRRPRSATDPFCIPFAFSTGSIRLSAHGGLRWCDRPPTASVCQGGSSTIHEEGGQVGDYHDRAPSGASARASVSRTASASSRASATIALAGRSSCSVSG
jgi:hypothetical protein